MLLIRKRLTESQLPVSGRIRPLFPNVPEGAEGQSGSLSRTLRCVRTAPL